MNTLLVSRRALFVLLLGVGACARSAIGTGQSSAGSAAREADDRILRVESSYWSPLVIELIGDGVRRRIGTVERQQPRTFRLPAHLVGSGKFVSLEAREDGAPSGYTTSLFTLAPGEGVSLVLEHTLTMSTFEIRRR
jgi:hypothetical protein